MSALESSRRAGEPLARIRRTSYRCVAPSFQHLLAPAARDGRASARPCTPAGDSVSKVAALAPDAWSRWRCRWQLIGPVAAGPWCKYRAPPRAGPEPRPGAAGRCRWRSSGRHDARTADSWGKVVWPVRSRCGPASRSFTCCERSLLIAAADEDNRAAVVLLRQARQAAAKCSGGQRLVCQREPAPTMIHGRGQPARRSPAQLRARLGSGT